MRIRFYKLSDERHILEIVKEGHSESVDCETRSYLVHDLLHFAVESEAKVQGGLWGSLAGGRTLAPLKGAAADEPVGDGPDLGAVEQIVGALHESTKGRSPAELAAGIRRFAEALQTTMPGWLTEAFIAALQERMRQLMGRWRATPFGGVMELEW